VIIGRFLQI